MAPVVEDNYFQIRRLTHHRAHHILRLSSGSLLAAPSPCSPVVREWLNMTGHDRTLFQLPDNRLSLGRTSVRLLKSST